MINSRDAGSAPGPLALRPLGRRPFFWMACLLMAVKYNLDRAVAWWGFGRSWRAWDYLSASTAPLPTVQAGADHFYLVLLLISLPFAAAGIWLVLRRLRSAGMPWGLCVLFFLPVVNLLFFVLLCLAPAREDAPPKEAEARRRSAPGGWLPSSPAGSALVSIGLVGLAGVAIAQVGTHAAGVYGLGLFVGLPFVLGLGAVLLYAASGPRSLASCLLVSVLPLGIVAAALLAMAAEGLICLVMALPLGLPLSLLGGFVGYTIVKSRRAGLPPAATALLFAALPFLMGMERRADPQPPLLAVTSAVVVDAAPEKVWPNVVAFPPIPPARDLLLRTGIAYPTRARIDGAGVGAVRHCIFSTGEFVEPVEVWDAPRLLRFSVSAQPEPMEELSPYGHIETPHLHGYMRSQEGEIRLVALPGGKTRLEGTTWYTNRIWPAAYWRLWSDLIVHRIHLRVLNHIKAVSEA